MLARRSCGNQNAPALQRPVAQHQARRAVGELDGLEHPASADFAAGLIPLCRAEYLNAAALQRRHVRARRAVGPHHPVHRGRQGDRRLRSQAHGGQQIVRLARCQTRYAAGTRRCNEDEVRPARKLDVAHRSFRGRIPQVRPDRTARHSLKGERRDELPGGRGHDDLHVSATLEQPTHEVGALVGGYAARDTQKDPFALH